MDIAVVGVGASVTLDGDKVKAARIGLGAVAATPLLASKAADALIGKKLDDASLEAAGHAASEVCKPIDDMRGTAEFRLHIAGVLTRRALTIAAERAKKD
jgi:carbon-monoxide dehydrogenase medium subunit